MTTEHITLEAKTAEKNIAEYKKELSGFLANELKSVESNKFITDTLMPVVFDNVLKGDLQRAEQLLRAKQGETFDIKTRMPMGFSKEAVDGMVEGIQMFYTENKDGIARAFKKEAARKKTATPKTVSESVEGDSENVGEEIFNEDGIELEVQGGKIAPLLVGDLYEDNGKTKWKINQIKVLNDSLVKVLLESTRIKGKEITIVLKDWYLDKNNFKLVTDKGLQYAQVEKNKQADRKEIKPTPSTQPEPVVETKSNQSEQTVVNETPSDALAIIPGETVRSYDQELTEEEQARLLQLNEKVSGVVTETIIDKQATVVGTQKGEKVKPVRIVKKPLSEGPIDPKAIREARNIINEFNKDETKKEAARGKQKQDIELLTVVGFGGTASESAQKHVTLLIERNPEILKMKSAEAIHGAIRKGLLDLLEETINEEETHA